MRAFTNEVFTHLLQYMPTHTGYLIGMTIHTLLDMYRACLIDVFELTTATGLAACICYLSSCLSKPILMQPNPSCFTNSIHNRSAWGCHAIGARQMPYPLKLYKDSTFKGSGRTSYHYARKQEQFVFTMLTLQALFAVP